MPGRARVKVEHHPFFSVRETRVLRKALAARPRVKLAVASSLQADLDGDGKTDARSTQKSPQMLAAPDRRKSPAPLAHQQGDEPLRRARAEQRHLQQRDRRGSGRPRTSGTAGAAVICPPAFPYATGSVSTQTNSKRYTQTDERHRPSETTTTRINDHRRQRARPPDTRTRRRRRAPTPTNGLGRGPARQRRHAGRRRRRPFPCLLHGAGLGTGAGARRPGDLLPGAGMVFALWAREDMEAETGVSGGRPGAMMLAYNVGSDGEVDQLLDAAAAAGGTIVVARPADGVGRLVGQLRRPRRPPLGGGPQPVLDRGRGRLRVAGAARDALGDGRRRRLRRGGVVAVAAGLLARHVVLDLRRRSFDRSQRPAGRTSWRPPRPAP